MTIVGHNVAEPHEHASKTAPGVLTSRQSNPFYLTHLLRVALKDEEQEWQWPTEVRRLASPPGQLGIALLTAEMHRDWAALITPVLKYSPRQWRSHSSYREELRQWLGWLWRLFADAVNETSDELSEAVYLASRVTTKSRQMGLYFSMQPKYKWDARHMCGAITYGVAKRNVSARYRKPTKKQLARTTTPRAEAASRGVLPQCGVPRDKNRRRKRRESRAPV